MMRISLPLLLAALLGLAACRAPPSRPAPPAPTAPAAPLVSLRAFVAGHDALIEVPARVVRDASGLRASGDVELEQTTLGLTPFAAMLGALRVAHTIGVHFDIVARPVAIGAGAQ